MQVIEKDKRRLAELFQAYRWNYLPDAILDGTMGRALVDDEDRPQVAVLQMPSIRLSIVGGDAGHPCAREYMAQLPTPAILICTSDGWEALMREFHAGRLITMPRYAFSSENLDRAHLRRLASQIPDGYQLKPLDLELARQLAEEKSGFSSDHMLTFESPEDLIERGFGFCLLRGDEIVSVATTFAVCDKGIEIQIDTRPKHQGRGLATVVAAHLLLHSLKNNLDPNWDAANERSVRLARKLGYTPQGNYSLYVVVRSRILAAVAGVGLKIKQFFGE